MRIPSLTLLTSCLATTASCAHQVEPGGPVPAVTPDTLPDWIYAVDSVNGQVIGGRRLFGDDGYYYVLIEDDHPDTPGQALVEAMELLDSLPQVAGASLVQIFSPDSIPSGALADSIYAPERISDPRLGSWVPRDIVFISFVPDATQEQRQEACSGSPWTAGPGWAARHRRRTAQAVPQPSRRWTSERRGSPPTDVVLGTLTVVADVGGVGRRERPSRVTAPWRP